MSALPSARGGRPAELPAFRGGAEAGTAPATHDNGGNRMTIVWILIVIILFLLAIYLFRRVV